MEVYVDDMLVKYKQAEDHIADFTEMFHILRKYRMKLNPQKCVFGVESGKFLGFMVNHRGIKANPTKIRALLDMKSSTSVKQVQSLTRRIAALNRFISKSSDRCKEFFKAYRIKVHTAYPLRHILYKPKSSGRMLKWAVELGQFDLEYCACTSIKRQTLADFILEFDSKVDDKAIVLAELSSQGNAPVEKIALEVGVVNLIARSDSELVVNQVNGEFQARGPQTELYMRCVQRLLRRFGSAKLEAMLREENGNADALAKMGSQMDIVSLGQIPLGIQFGIPYKLISDNGKQFDSKKLRKLCEYLNIKKDFAAVYHPLSNGQTEAIKKIIKHTLKAKLEEKKGGWPEQMPMVLWSYNTSPRSTTGESPFMLIFGYEAMIPMEEGAGLLRRDLFIEEDAEVNQRLHLDLLDEAKMNSQLKLVAY
ncbi:uncharacterized protein LOC141665262 [Apium graveolens]|uniref:uncharacterized protein LOC141665262 n=1 Tax=Apium graveolens TaxID=4045 RepID=UPI003D7992C7